MVIATPGMVLYREKRREYDERILFFTEGLGKVWVYSFGSQSPASLRGQRLAQLGWLGLELEKKGGRLLLLEVAPSPLPPDYQKDKAYFLGWTQFLKDLSGKIPPSAPVPGLFSVLTLLTGFESTPWPQGFREFTWYFSSLLELGIFPNFRACRQCGKYCSDDYFFSLPGEVVGSGCIAKMKNPHEDWAPERLALEEVYFLNYCQEHYVADLDFFKKILTLARKFSPDPAARSEASSAGREMSLHWEAILSVLRKVFLY